MKRGAVAQQIGMFLSAFLFIYLAATGPVGAYCEITDIAEDSRLYHAIKILYLPVIALSDNFPIVESVLTSYGDFCEEIYRKHHPRSEADPQTVANE